jgi:hypothetical protein
MKFPTRIAQSPLAKPIAVLFFLSAVLIVSGCGQHRNTRSTNVASHKVTVDRQGITNRFGVEDRGQLAIFHYDGLSFTGTRLVVTIENDKVAINDNNAGLLKQGDAVHIGDDGLTVNSLDYGQTAKYLQENLKQFVAQNVDK